MSDRQRLFLKIGDKVRSRFRSRWTGTIVDISKTPGCVIIEVTHDSCGNPQRKPFKTSLHQHWLTKI